MCLSDDYLIIDLGDQYVDNQHNKLTHIYSLEMNAGMVDRHNFLPWPGQMLFDSYDYHVASHSFTMSQRFD